LEKHSPAFKQWQAARTAELRAQGEALASVMETGFKEAVAMDTLPVPTFPPAQPVTAVTAAAGAAAAAPMMGCLLIRAATCRRFAPLPS